MSIVKFRTRKVKRRGSIWDSKKGNNTQTKLEPHGTLESDGIPTEVVEVTYDNET